MQKGKYLEKKCRDLFKAQNIWFHRYYDTYSAGRYLPDQPADFQLLLPEPVFIECKETNSLKLPISAFRPSQLKAMRDMKRLKIKYYIVVLYQKRLYGLLNSINILTTIKNKKKSIDINSNILTPDIDDVFWPIYK